MRLGSILLLLFGAAELAAQTADDLLAVDGTLQRKQTSAAWSAAADLAARMGRWTVAATAQETACAMDFDEAALTRERLLAARYELNAGYDSAAGRTLSMLPQSRPALWLRVELALARNQPDAALRLLEAAASAPVDAALIQRLYCCDSALKAVVLEQFLRASAELANGETAAALAEAQEVVRNAPSFADGQLLLADALHASGRTNDALRELDALREVTAPPAGCPVIRVDRLLFNRGNVLADAGHLEVAISSYEEAIAAAGRREEQFRKLLDAAPAHKTPFLVLLRSDVRAASELVPDVRNNLGYALLRLAALRGNDKELLARAERSFTLAANNVLYPTRHYAYLGRARAQFADGRVADALEAAAMALTNTPQYEDALDFLADLTRSKNADTAERAGILLAGHASRALPAQYARAEYGSVLAAAASTAGGRNSPLAQQFLASVDVFNGDYAAAEAKIAQAGPSSSPWAAALRMKIAASRGDLATALATGDELQRAMKSRRPHTPWEAATLADAVARFAMIDPYRAETLVTRFVTPQAGFPWEPAIFGSALTGTDVLPGSTIRVRLADGTTRTTVADAQGNFELAVPTEGTYVIEASLEGMEPVSQRVTAGAEGVRTRLTLTIGPTEERVTVTARPSVVSTADTAIHPSEVEGLPNVSRLVLPSAATLTGSSAAATPTFAIDGVDTSEPFRLDPGVWLDIVQEMAVVTAGVPVPIAGAAVDQGNSIVRMTSRSGTNNFEGNAQLDGQPTAARASARPVAMPWAMHDDRDVRETHATFGGPFIPDHLWFFAAGDLEKERGRPLATAAKDVARARQIRLFGKISAAIAQTAERLLVERQVRVRTGIVDDPAGVAFGDPSAISRTAQQASTIASVAGTAIVTSHLLLDSHASWENDTSMLRPTSAAGDVVQMRLLNDFYAIGGVGVIDDGRRFRRGNIGATVSYKYGEQEFRFSGFQTDDRDHLRDRLSGGAMQDELGPAPSFVRYWSLGDDRVPAVGVDETFDSALTTGIVGFTGNYDRRWTVVTNLRWDRQHVAFPSGQRLTTSILQPHVDIHYDPFGDGNWNLSTSFRRIGNPLEREDRIAFGTQRRYVVTAGGGAAGAYGGLLRVDSSLAPASEDELMANVFHRIGQTNLRLSVVHRALRNEIEDYFCSARNERCIGNPGRGPMATPAADAVTNRVEARVAHIGRVDWEVDYRWLRTRANIESPDLASTHVLGIDPYSRPAFDSAALVPPDGPMAREHRNTLRATATRSWAMEASRKFIAGADAFWNSGEPRTLFTYSILYGRYVAYTGPRGSVGYSPATADLDLRVTYETPVGDGAAKLQISAAVQNVLNRQTSIVDDQRAGLTGLPMARLAPRSARLAARVMF
jgi:Tetratricopeptide repeat